jgi:hypothetical protein
LRKFSSPNLNTESDLRRCAKDDQDKVVNLHATVEGVVIPDLKKNRMQSPLLNMTDPKDNVMGIPPGTTQAVSDGLASRPLELEQHYFRRMHGLILALTRIHQTQMVK